MHLCLFDASILMKVYCIG